MSTFGTFASRVKDNIGIYSELIALEQIQVEKYVYVIFMFYISKNYDRKVKNIATHSSVFIAKSIEDGSLSDRLDCKSFAQLFRLSLGRP